MVARRFHILALLLILCLLGLEGCAKIGEPQPPQVLVPKPAVDLAARQFSDRILLTVSQPVENTNGSRVTTLDRVEVFRLAGDRQDAGPLQDQAFLAGAEQIQSISARELPGHFRNGALAFWDLKPADPASFYAQGLRYAVRFINRKNQTAGLSNQAFVAPVAIPAAPEGLSCELFRERIRLTWKAPEKNADGSAPARIAGYNVYRSEDAKTFPVTPLNIAPLPAPEFEDRSFEFDKTYYYAVSVVGSTENPYAESFTSNPLAITPVDRFPPGMPKNLDAVVENGVVTLLWSPPEDTDLAGYRVYRKEEGSAARSLLQAQLVVAWSFRDDQAILGKKYEYSVAAVDTHGNESQASTVAVEVK
jgi:hypothetical protein